MSDQTAPTYLEPIRDELDRLRAGSDHTPRDPAYGLTPGQLWAMLLEDGTDKRIEHLASLLESQAAAAHCFLMNHKAMRRDLEQAEQRINDLMARLDDRSAALNRTGASNDTIRAQIAAVEKVAASWEAEAAEHRGTAVSVDSLTLADYHRGMSNSITNRAEAIRAALAVPTDQEPAK